MIFGSLIFVYILQLFILFWVLKAASGHAVWEQTKLHAPFLVVIYFISLPNFCVVSDTALSGSCENAGSDLARHL